MYKWETKIPQYLLFIIHFMTELMSCCDFKLMKVSSRRKVYSLHV